MRSLAIFTSVTAALIALPFLQPNTYWLHVFGVALIGVILALGMQLLIGMAGILSLGQGAFYGLGAYTSAILTVHFGVPFFFAFFAAGIVAALSSLLLIPIVRLKGSSLAVATLGFNIIIYLVLLNEDWATGGSYGLMNVPAPSVFGLEFPSERALYYICLAVAAATFFGINRLANSRFGRALKAISQDEDAALASGISINVYKSKCFLVAAFTAGIAGSLYAHHARYLSPNDFDFNKSIEILIMVVVGGLGSLPGAVIGAIIIVLIPEYLRSSGELRLIIYGLMLIVLVGINGGVVGLLAIVTQSLRTFRLRGAFSPSAKR